MTDIKETIERLEGLQTAWLTSVSDGSLVEQVNTFQRFTDRLSQAFPTLITAFKELEGERDRLKAGWKGAQAGWSELIEEHRALEAERDRLREESWFLLGRLNEFACGDTMTDEGARDYAGHVSPSAARLASILKALEPKP